MTLSRVGLIKPRTGGKCLQWLQIQQDLPRDLSGSSQHFQRASLFCLSTPPLEIVPRILILRGLGAEKWTIYSDRLLDMSPPLFNGSPTDKSEIPIWFPQSNVTKSNVTKPLLQIGFLTHWKERSGILVRRRGTGTAGFLIFRQFWLIPRRGGQTAARKVQSRFREYVRKIFPGEYGGQRNQRHSTTERLKWQYVRRSVNSSIAKLSH